MVSAPGCDTLTVSEKRRLTCEAFVALKGSKGVARQINVVLKGCTRAYKVDHTTPVV
jgi:hypothetical protein